MRNPMHATYLSRSATRALVLAVAVLALAATKGPDGGGYTATDAVVFSMVDLSGGSGGVSVLSGVDDGVAPLTLPFPFRFYGTAYSVVCVSTNGILYFVGVAGACSDIDDFSNVDITTAGTPKDLPAALPLWTDLSFDVPGSGSVLYQTIGALGTRRFVIQWNNAYPVGATAPVTFQAVLSETAHTLLFQYQSLNVGVANAASNGGTATVGIRNSQALSTNKHLSWSFNAPVMADSSALSFAAPVVKVTGDADGDGAVTCTDLSIVRAAFGRRKGQSGYDARADLNGDGIVNLMDVSIVSRALPTGTKC
jgi:hypothetical protein